MTGSTIARRRAHYAATAAVSEYLDAGDRHRAMAIIDQLMDLEQLADAAARNGGGVDEQVDLEDLMFPLRERLWELKRENLRELPLAVHTSFIRKVRGAAEVAW